MSIEKDLERIANAIEFIAASMRNGNAQTSTAMVAQTSTAMVAATAEVVEKLKPAQKMKTTKKTEKLEAAPVKAAANVDVTKEQLADALRECVMKIGPVETKAILAKYNATRLSEIKPEDAASAYNALKEKANG